MVCLRVVLAQIGMKRGTLPGLFEIVLTCTAEERARRQLEVSDCKPTLCIARACGWARHGPDAMSSNKGAHTIFFQVHFQKAGV